MTTCACDRTLCAPCREQLLKDLRVVAGVGDWEGSPLIEELEVTITRQNVMPAMKVESSGTRDRTPILFHLQASDAAKNLRVTMRRVYQAMVVENPHLMSGGNAGKSVTTTAHWLLLFPDLMAEHPNAVSLASAVRLAVYEGLRVIDSPPEKMWLGFCPSCARSLHVTVESGDTLDERLVKCCGEATTVRELRARLRGRLSQLVVTASESVGLVHAFTGSRKSVDTIRRQLKRKGVLPVIRLEGGPKKYRASDIVDAYLGETDEEQ